MSSATVLHPATYEDLCAVPPEKVAEILAGELFVSPRPAGFHALAGSLVGGDLLGPFHRKPGGPGGPGGWIILDEPELHLGDDVVVPDVAGWRRDRMPKVENVPFFTLPPDWVCEVASPRTRRADRLLKMPIYAREKVPWLWLVEPLDRLLEVYRLDGPGWRVEATFGGNGMVRAPPFDAIEIELGRWWGEE
jgi:Uma2 family endonuclease